MKKNPAPSKKQENDFCDAVMKACYDGNLNELKSLGDKRGNHDFLKYRDRLVSSIRTGASGFRGDALKIAVYRNHLDIVCYLVENQKKTDARLLAQCLERSVPRVLSNQIEDPSSLAITLYLASVLPDVLPPVYYTCLDDTLFKCLELAPFIRDEDRAAFDELIRVLVAHKATIEMRWNHDILLENIPSTLYVIKYQLVDKRTILREWPCLRRFPDIERLDQSELVSILEAELVARELVGGYRRPAWQT